MADEIRVGLIGGSGLADALRGQTETLEPRRHEVQTPFGPPSDAILETRWAGLPVFLLSRHGPGHVLNPSQVPYRANIFALKALGCTHVLASGAVGSLREEFRPRDLVIPDQVIDKTHKRPGTFFERAAVHVEFAEPFCPMLRRILVEAGKGSGSGVQAGAQSTVPLDPEPRTPSPEPFRVHDRGCYVCMEGPAFSTRAESLMHRLWGGDLIGMTAMPEAKLSREAEMSYAMVALVTDYDCWRSHAASPESKPDGGGKPALDPFVLLKEIIGNLQAASTNAIALMRRAVEMMEARRDELIDSPARQALKLAIWSDKSRIDPAEVQRLGPLWMKYFG
jgi:5'-methylthioadenosine phosphorylase